MKSREAFRRVDLLRCVVVIQMLGLHLHSASVVQFSATAYEAAENAGNAAILVQRTNDLGTAVTVDYFSRDTTGRAAAGLDYTAVSGTLSFGPGEAERTFTVPILNDGLVEVLETFGVVLTNATGGAELGSRQTANVRIIDNDTAGIQFEFGSSTFGSYRVGESAGFIVLGVMRGDDGNFPVRVDLATSDLTATSGLDYTGVTNTLIFAAGEKVQTFTIPILIDALEESSESFRVTLSNPTNQVLGAQNIATVTIVDNDAGVQFQPHDLYRVAENEGARTLTVVRGSDGNLGPLAVDYATSNCANDRIMTTF